MAHMFIVHYIYQSLVLSQLLNVTQLSIKELFDFKCFLSQALRRIHVYYPWMLMYYIHQQK